VKEQIIEGIAQHKAGQAVKFDKKEIKKRQVCG